MGSVRICRGDPAKGDRFPATPRLRVQPCKLALVGVDTSTTDASANREISPKEDHPEQWATLAAKGGGTRADSERVA